MLLDGAVGIQNVYVLNEHFNNLKYAKFNNLNIHIQRCRKHFESGGVFQHFS